MIEKALVEFGLESEDAANKYELVKIALDSGRGKKQSIKKAWFCKVGTMYTNYLYFSDWSYLKQWRHTLGGSQEKGVRIC